MTRFQKSRGLLGGAASCLMALSLLVGTSCAPLCAGAACLPQNAGSEGGCHGIMSHNAASSFLAAHATACKLGETGVAVVGKAGFFVNPVAPAAEFLAAANSLKSFIRSSSEVWISGSPPGIAFSHTPSLVLRV